MNTLLLESSGSGSSWIMLAVLAVLVVVMLVFPMITRKRQIKEYTEMVDALKAGDEIMTVGGIIGRIVKVVKKDGVSSIIISTGDKASQTTMEIDISHIQMLLNQTNSSIATKAEENKLETKVSDADSGSNEVSAETKEETKPKKQPAKKSKK